MRVLIDPSALDITRRNRPKVALHVPRTSEKSENSGNSRRHHRSSLQTRNPP